VIRLILMLALFFAPLCTNAQKDKSKAKPATSSANPAAGHETFLKYCASCHGTTAKGDGPAAFVMKPPPPDLTTLTKRHEDKFPAGYIGALLRFGRNFAAHGAEEMPVWGAQFQSLDPVKDPTGQQHIDDVVAYIRSIQVK
jgi:mono/diheme cytochrome c family protein